MARPAPGIGAAGRLGNLRRERACSRMRLTEAGLPTTHSGCEINNRANMAFVAINIDFGHPSTGPGNSYAGAGLAGFWNVIDSASSTAVGNIRDTAGVLTGVTLSTTQGMFDVTPSAQPFSATHTPLLGDYLVGGANEFTLTLSGLPEGNYSVIVYTVGRQDFARSSTVTPFGNDALMETNTGIYAGSLQEGVTHSVHELFVPASGLSLEIFSSSDGFINGLQVQSIPEPGSAILMFAGLILAAMSRKRA